MTYRRIGPASLVRLLGAWRGEKTGPAYRQLADSLRLLILDGRLPLDVVLPEANGLPMRAAFLLGGVVLNGMAGAMYIGAGLGPGPRDGLMTGLARRTGWSLRSVRTGIELSVLAAGWLLGGTVGVGTVLYAFAIGPLVQAFLPAFTIRDAGPQKNAAVNA